MSQFQLSSILPLLLRLFLFVGLLILIASIIIVIRKTYGLLVLYRSKCVALCITPPAFDDKNPIATESLFSAMHALGSSRTIKERLLGKEYIYSAEIHSSKQTGIQFFVVTDSTRASSLEKLITAYVPDAKVQKEDAIPIAPLYKILSYRQSKSYVYPLKEQEFLERMNNHIGFSEENDASFEPPIEVFPKTRYVAIIEYQERTE